MNAADVFCVCSACDADLRGGVRATTKCEWGCGQDSHYSRACGWVEGDRVVAWTCPDCGRSIPRGQVRS